MYVQAAVPCDLATEFVGCQIFASHAVGGLVGNILTAFFAQKSIASFDGYTEINGGWIDHHWVQLGYHVADSVAGIAYSLVVTVSTPFNGHDAKANPGFLDWYPLDDALHPRAQAPRLRRYGGHRDRRVRDGRICL